MGRNGKSGFGGTALVSASLVGAILATASSAFAQAAPTSSGILADLARYDENFIIRTPRPAIAALPDAIARARADKSVPMAAHVAASHTLAFAYAYDGQFAKGIETLDEVTAWLASRVSASNPLLIETTRRKALLMGLSGKAREARPILEGIVAQFEKSSVAGGADHAIALNSLATTMVRGGDFSGAVDVSNRALDIGARAANMPPRVMTDVYSANTAILQMNARYFEALDVGLRALKFVEDHPELGSDARTTALNNLAVAYSDVGRTVEAEEIMRRAIAIEQGVEGTTKAAMAMKLNNFASMLALNGKTDEAEAMMQSAISANLAATQPQRPDAPAGAMLNYSVFLDGRARYDEALTQARAAETYAAEKVGKDHPIWGRAKSAAGRALLGKGDARAALAELEPAVALLTAKLAPNDPIRLMAEGNLARARLLTGDKSAYDDLHSVFERYRNRVIALAAEPAGSIRLARDSANDFAIFARLALAAGREEDAFEALQLARFGELDVAGASSALRRLATDKPLADALRGVQDANAAVRKLTTARVSATAAGDVAKITELDRQIVESQGKAAALVKEIAAANPSFAAARLPVLPKLAAVREHLGPDEALLFVLPSADSVTSALITRNRLAYGITSQGRGELAQWSDKLRQSIDAALGGDPAAAFDADSAYRLYRAMVPQRLESDVARARTLLVMAGGVLESIPLSALVTRPTNSPALSGESLRSAPWLIRRQAVAVPPSLDLLEAPTRAMTRASLRFAGIGAPTLAPARSLRLATRGGLDVTGSLDTQSLMKMPSLPEAQGELEKMRDALGGSGSLLLTGKEALKSRIMAGALENYGVLAFATHGLVGGELRGLGEPALVLSPPVGNASADAMLLTASDVAKLKLDADWVVLSACNTAAGEGGDAPTYSGLARAFVYAGARSLLVSHWALRDDVAARLTVDTIKGARGGLSHAEALRRAQLALIADKSVPGGAHPAAWAPFILLGE